MRSPLVCFSSPQIMRRNVVLPQPDGPSSTMNSPSGTVRLMPFTAETSPNFLMISLVNTAAIEPPRIQRNASAPPNLSAAHHSCLSHLADTPQRRHDPDRAPGRTRSGRQRLGLSSPLLEYGVALLRGPLD